MKYLPTYFFMRAPIFFLTLARAVEHALAASTTIKMNFLNGTIGTANTISSNQFFAKYFGISK